MAAVDHIASAAQQLRAAMEGFGTDEAKLIRVVAHLKPTDVAKVALAYNKAFGRDLEQDIKKETSGNFEDSLVAMLTGPLAYDAQLLFKAMKGVGTNEKLLTEVLCTRNFNELKEIRVEFKRQFQHDLEEDIRGETRGNLEKFYVSRLKGEPEKCDFKRDVDVLYKAGQGRIGTDDGVFISLLTNRTPDDIRKLNTEYANAHGKSLAKVIESEFSGDLRDGLLALVTPVDEFFAHKLREAMKGMGTDDATLIRIIASQRGRNLKAIAAAYLKLYEKSLKAAVAEECSGDYKKLLVAVIEHEVENK